MPPLNVRHTRDARPLHRLPRRRRTWNAVSRRLWDEKRSA